MLIYQLFITGWLDEYVLRVEVGLLDTFDALRVNVEDADPAAVRDVPDGLNAVVMRACVDYNNLLNTCGYESIC